MTTKTNAAPSAEDLQDMVSKAMRRAWQLGQTYWQQADSEYASQHRKADVTQAKFDALIDETRASLSIAAQPPAAATKEMMVAAVKFANGPAVYKNVAEAALIIEEQIYGEIYEAMLAAAPKEANEPVPLTEETLKRMHHEDQFGLFCDYDDFEQIVRATEQAHGIQPAHKEQLND